MAVPYWSQTASKLLFNQHLQQIGFNTDQCILRVEAPLSEFNNTARQLAEKKKIGFIYGQPKVSVRIVFVHKKAWCTEKLFFGYLFPIISTKQGIHGGSVDCILKACIGFLNF